MSFLCRDTLIAYYVGHAPGANRDVQRRATSSTWRCRSGPWRRGFQRFDFGRSRKDSGAFDFKQHQGFEPLDLQYRYHLVRDRRPPSLTPSNPRTRLPREVWSRLPLGVTRRLSNLVAKYLP